MSLMEKITKVTVQRDGKVPLWVMWLVRSVIVMVWFTHDNIFAPICGRGDGLNERTSELLQESTLKMSHIVRTET